MATSIYLNIDAENVEQQQQTMRYGGKINTWYKLEYEQKYKSNELEKNTYFCKVKGELNGLHKRSNWAIERL